MNTRYKNKKMSETDKVSPKVEMPEIEQPSSDPPLPHDNADSEAHVSDVKKENSDGNDDDSALQKFITYESVNFLADAPLLEGRATRRLIGFISKLSPEDTIAALSPYARWYFFGYDTHPKTGEKVLQGIASTCAGNASRWANTINRAPDMTVYIVKNGYSALVWGMAHDYEYQSTNEGPWKFTESKLLEDVRKLRKQEEDRKEYIKSAKCKLSSATLAELNAIYRKRPPASTPVLNLQDNMIGDSNAEIMEIVTARSTIRKNNREIAELKAKIEQLTSELEKANLTNSELIGYRDKIKQHMNNIQKVEYVDKSTSTCDSPRHESTENQTHPDHKEINKSDRIEEEAKEDEKEDSNHNDAVRSEIEEDIAAPIQQHELEALDASWTTAAVLLKESKQPKKMEATLPQHFEIEPSLKKRHKLQLVDADQSLLNLTTKPLLLKSSQKFPQ